MVLKMNRRGFLKRLGISVAGAVVTAPIVIGCIDFKPETVGIIVEETDNGMTNENYHATNQPVTFGSGASTYNQDLPYKAYNQELKKMLGKNNGPSK